MPLIIVVHLPHSIELSPYAALAD
eukprot:SAG25_NODE_8117_length_439_cov_0.761765_1_plen_23_part_10